MEIRNIAPGLAVSSQLAPADLATLKEAGYASIICNRPDGEGPGQPPFATIEAEARRLGMQARYLPVVPGQLTAGHGAGFAALLAGLPGPVLAYCRTGKRSETLFGMAQEAQAAPPAERGGAEAAPAAAAGAASGAGRYPVLIVGGGAAGIATAASLLAREPGLRIAVIDPASVHYYQPGWTLVGAGVFEAARTVRSMRSMMPRGVEWIQGAVARFQPELDAVELEDGRTVHYQRLVVCPGLKLDWDGVAGLRESLGRNGVTSNYLASMASYTWELVQGLRAGRALFTQPPMPIKCAGAPQKAMYLAADHWKRAGVLDNIDIEFCSAGAVLFGVPEYVPPLMEYVNGYGIALNFGETLVAVDGPRRVATFRRVEADGSARLVEKEFDMLHVVPPQVAPDFVRNSPLADKAGWVEVDQGTLAHARFPGIYALGDVAGTANAKTAAAARKQAPVVAHNVLASLGKVDGTAIYDGYGSCPLTVERGKVVLAEFTYGGKLAPSFPAWLIDGTRPSRLAWLLKSKLLPPLYWHGMLKGRELMAEPARLQ